MQITTVGLDLAKTIFHVHCHCTLNNRNSVQKYPMISIGVCTLEFHTVLLTPILYP